MSENYTTIQEKLKSIGIETDSVYLDKLAFQLKEQGVKTIGYCPSADGSKEQLLYDTSEGFDGALERCGVSLPKKGKQEAVEVKKGRGRKIEKHEETIAEVSE